MKKHGIDDTRGGPGAPLVSAATLRDLALAESHLAEAERLRAEATVALARVRARGDGEAATGMPMTQHLRWKTRVRRETLTSIGVISDVAAELPSVIAALEAGALTLDQASAVAWPAAKVSRGLRLQLDGALACEDGWTTWSPERLRYEVETLLDELHPRTAEERDERGVEQQYFHLEPTLDGQGAKFHGYAHGLDAAQLEGNVRDAADSPEATPASQCGTLAGLRTKRGNQLFEGLMRIIRSWTGDPDTSRPVTIYAIVDETDDGAGSGEVLTATRGLSPRLTTKAVKKLVKAGARRIEVYAIDRDLVRVKGRAGHALDDPDRLSEDTTKILCTIRDRGCRMPGCDRPAEHLHHLVWRGLARARGEVAPDDPQHRAFLCLPCHRLVHRWQWAGTVGAVGRTTWTRAGPAGRTTTSTPGRLARRLRRPPFDHEVDREQIHLDPYGDPLPF